MGFKGQNDAFHVVPYSCFPPILVVLSPGLWWSHWATGVLPGEAWFLCVLEGGWSFYCLMWTPQIYVIYRCIWGMAHINVYYLYNIRDIDIQYTVYNILVHQWKYVRFISVQVYDRYNYHTVREVFDVITHSPVSWIIEWPSFYFAAGACEERIASLVPVQHSSKGCCALVEISVVIRSNPTKTPISTASKHHWNKIRTYAENI